MFCSLSTSTSLLREKKIPTRSARFFFPLSVSRPSRDKGDSVDIYNVNKVSLLLVLSFTSLKKNPNLETEKKGKKNKTHFSSASFSSAILTKSPFFACLK